MKDNELEFTSACPNCECEITIRAVSAIALQKKLTLAVECIEAVERQDRTRL